jgi:hypothetical protein
MNCNIHGLLSKSRAKNVLGEKVQYKLLSNFTQGSLIVQCKTCGFIYKPHWVPRMSTTRKHKHTCYVKDSNIKGYGVFCNYIPPDILSTYKDISRNNCRTFFVN